MLPSPASAPRANWFALSVILLALAMRWAGLPLHLMLAHHDVVPASEAASHRHTHQDRAGHAHHDDADHGHGGHPPHPVAEHAEDPVCKRGVTPLDSVEPAARAERAPAPVGDARRTVARWAEADEVSEAGPARVLRSRGPPRMV